MSTTIARLPARRLVRLGSLGSDEWFDHEGQLYRIYCVIPDEEGLIRVFAHDQNCFAEDAMSPDVMVEPMDVLFVVRPRAMERED